MIDTRRMKRQRILRERREKLLSTARTGRSAATAKTRNAKQARKRKRAQPVDRLRTRSKRSKIADSLLPPVPPIEFLSYASYVPTQNISVLHVCESFGLGGAQMMLFELHNSLKNFYGDHYAGHLAMITTRRDHTGVLQNNLYRSYCKDQIQMITVNELRKKLKGGTINVVVHHRISISGTLERYIPQGVKYVLINHTHYGRDRMQKWAKLDYLVSVCKFFVRHHAKHVAIDESRHISILNGYDNDFTVDVEPDPLEGELITGRCHRLVGSKFRTDSLRWIHGLKKRLPGHIHYLLGGGNSHAKQVCRTLRTCVYLGSIVDQIKKTKFIRGLDICLYEIFQHEGASMAVLEALANGVPVICKDFGGIRELIKNDVNGFICKDRTEMAAKLMQFYRNKEMLAELKAKTLADFNARLHAKFTACKYMQLFERAMSE